LVDVEPLGLHIGTVRASHLRSLVPVELEPAQPLDDDAAALLGAALLIRVLDPQDEDTIVISGPQPVEKRRADSAAMGVAGGGGGEADAWRAGNRRLGRHGRFAV